MKSTIRDRVVILGLLITAGLVPYSQSLASVNSRLEAISLTSMVESQGNAMHAFSELGYFPAGSTLSWNGYYNESGWTAIAAATVNGAPFYFSYSGVLSGDIGDNINVKFKGTGLIEHQGFTSEGTQTFNYNNTAGDYTSLLHTESGQIDSRWQLSAAAVLAGGSLGADGFTVNPAIGYTAALQGAGNSLALASYAFTEDPGGIIPIPPILPVLLDTPMPVNAEGWPDIKIIIILGGTITIGNSTPRISMDTNYADGVVNSSVSAIPEPSAWMMLMAGLGLVVLGYRERDQNATRLGDHATPES